MIPRPWVILLAAGASRRFGRPKLLARIRGESLLRSAAVVALGSGMSGTVVVLGANSARLRPELEGLPIHVIVNRHWRGGLSRSLAAGVAALPARARAALILLADQAAIGPADLELLAAAWRRHPRRIVAAYTAGVLSPPAIVPRSLFPALRNLRGQHGARDLLRDPARRAIGIELPGAALDVDRPADLARVSRARASARSKRSARSSREHRPRRSGAT